MKRDFTFSNCRRFLLLAVMTLLFASNANAGATWYAYYGKLVSYPTGAGQVYASETVQNTKDITGWSDETEVSFVAQFGSYNAYAKPAEGWILAGFTKAEMAADYSGYTFNDELVSTDNPASLEIESVFTDNADGQGTSDSATVAGLMPLDPITVNYAVFTHVVAEYAPGQNALGTLKLSKLSNNIGDDITLTATPADDRCHFQNWTLNGSVVSTEPSFNVHVTDTAHYIAHFTCNSAMVVNFPEEGGYYMYYPEEDLSVPSTVSSYKFLADSVRAKSVGGLNNFITPVVSSYYASAGEPVIFFGKGEATFVKTPVETAYPNESYLTAWSGADGVSVGSLEANKAYYSFDTANSVFKKMSNSETVPANTAYLALPDSCFSGLASAPEMFYLDSVSAVTNGIENVETVAVNGLGKIYTVSGVQVDAMKEDGLYIVDGKKVFFRKK